MLRHAGGWSSPPYTAIKKTLGTAMWTRTVFGCSCIAAWAVTTSSRSLYNSVFQDHFAKSYRRMAVAILLFVLSYLGFVLGEVRNVRASLGGRVTLPAFENCANARWEHRLDGDRSRPVADFDNRVFKPAAGYENRVTPVNDEFFSLVISHTTYNDQGYYEFSCGDRFVNTVRVDILVPFKQSVVEGQNATLRCYSVTTTEAAEFIRWERDGKLVFEWDVFGNVSYGTGFEERVSVSPHSYTEGDLSLTLTGVKQADQGLYRCYHGEDKVEPAAVKLTVNQATMKPEDNAKGALNTPQAVIISVVVTLLFSALLGVTVWQLKTRCPGVFNRRGSGPSPESPEDIPESDTNNGSESQPLDSAVNGSCQQCSNGHRGALT